MGVVVLAHYTIMLFVLYTLQIPQSRQIYVSLDIPMQYLNLRQIGFNRQGLVVNDQRIHRYITCIHADIILVFNYFGH